MVSRETTIIDYTKSVYQSFKNIGGRFVIDQSAKGKWKTFNDETIQFLADYLDFITSSGCLHKETMIWLDSTERRGIDAIRSYNDLHNEEEGFIPISEKSARNRMDHDKRRLLKMFPEDMLKNIYFGKADLEVYRAVLQSVINKKLGKNILGNGSVLKIPCIIQKDKPSDDLIDVFFELYAPYTKAMLRKIEEQLPREVIGYLNYISAKGINTPEEKVLLARLTQMIKLQS